MIRNKKHPHGHGGFKGRGFYFHNKGSSGNDHYMDDDHYSSRFKPKYKKDFHRGKKGNFRDEEDPTPFHEGLGVGIPNSRPKSRFKSREKLFQNEWCKYIPDEQLLRAAKLRVSDGVAVEDVFHDLMQSESRENVTHNVPVGNYNILSTSDNYVTSLAHHGNTYTERRLHPEENFEEPRFNIQGTDWVLNCFANSILPALKPDSLLHMDYNDGLKIVKYLFRMRVGNWPRPIDVGADKNIFNYGPISSDVWKRGLPNHVISIIEDTFYSENVFLFENRHTFLEFVQNTPSSSLDKVHSIILKPSVWEWAPSNAMMEANYDFTASDLELIRHLHLLRYLSKIQFDVDNRFTYKRFEGLCKLCEVFQFLSAVDIGLPEESTLWTGPITPDGIQWMRDLREKALMYMSNIIMSRKVERNMRENGGMNYGYEYQ